VSRDLSAQHGGHLDSQMKTRRTIIIGVLTTGVLFCCAGCFAGLYEVGTWLYYFNKERVYGRTTLRKFIFLERLSACYFREIRPCWWLE
jgi:hypothetical protein